MTIVTVETTRERTCSCGELMQEDIDWRNMNEDQRRRALQGATNEDIAMRVHRLHRIGAIGLRWRCNHCGCVEPLEPWVPNVKCRVGLGWWPG